LLWLLADARRWTFPSRPRSSCRPENPEENRRTPPFALQYGLLPTSQGDAALSRATCTDLAQSSPTYGVAAGRFQKERLVRMARKRCRGSSAQSDQGSPCSPTERTLLQSFDITDCSTRPGSLGFDCRRVPAVPGPCLLVGRRSRSRRGAIPVLPRLY